ncbi:MAG TPA: hypothetical protein DIW47_03360 [Bacteroidetes bacterium]|nr:hypothetical protein [Bacteroidota bacterium]
MKKLTIRILGFILSVEFLSACPVCEQQQPSITRGLTHGAGPESNWDWIIVSLLAGITLLTLILSLKLLIRPGEKSPDHVKLSVLNK